MSGAAPAGDSKSNARLGLVPARDGRRPSPGGTHVLCGYGLRLGDNFAIQEDDPLLANFGIVTPDVDSTSFEETLQDDAFSPGRRVLLLPGVDDPESEVSVWSEDSVRLAGSVTGEEGQQLAAALTLGLSVQAFVLDEWCHARTGQRAFVDLVVCPSTDVCLRVAEGRVLRPVRTERRRLVLIADGRADLDLWDPSGSHGPADAEDLGLSAGLQLRLDQLREGFAERDKLGACGGIDRLVAGWAAEALEEEARAVWRRLRAELGRRCEIGFLGPGMNQPAWEPLQLESDEHDAEDDIGFGRRS